MSLINPDMTNKALEAVKDERTKQDSKWGLQRHDNGTWMLILQEELGEVAQAQLQGLTLQHQIEELTQVTAVALAWLEQLMDYDEVQHGTRKYNYPNQENE